MGRDEVIATLLRHLAKLRGMGVRTLAVFGSVARDEAGPRSDVDLLIEMAAPMTFDRFMDIKLYLEDVLGRRVDLVTPSGLKPRIRERVLAEAVRVA